MDIPADSVVIRVLGPLDVECCGATVTIAAPMQRRVLAALAMADGATVSTDALVAALWGEDPPPSARNSLQSHVARLREAIGPGHGIVTRPPGYALDTTTVAVDARIFQDRVTAARGRVATDPAAAVDDLRRALAAWRGDAYGEFAADLAREEATRLHELQAEAMELLARALLSTDPVAAVDAARRLLGAHPLRESAALLAARALTAAGRVPEALEVLHDHRERLAEELGLDPSPAVAALAEELLRDPPPSQPMAPPGPRTGAVPPPRPVHAVLGRDEDLTRVRRARDESPLVTLVGPGGVGKTTLAATVAAGDGPAAWVELAAVCAADDVAVAVGEALGMSRGTQQRATVVDALRSFPGTVVLDNCEHVLDEVADLVGASLARPGSARLLATSRERLDLPGEVVVPLAPLPVPRPDDADGTDPAVRLFRERLRSSGGGDVPAALAAQVAAAVGGLPLGLELAAARATSLPVEALLARLVDDLDILGGSARRGTRHSTLTHVIAWSHDLLEVEEQTLFRRLSVFRATFRLVDAEAICADEDLPLARVAPALGRLVDASMVTRVGAERYRLLEPLRLFADGRLQDHGEAARVQTRQRAAVLATVERTDRAMSGPDEAATVPHVEHALPDIRAVHARALADEDLTTVARLAGGLSRFAYAQARPDLLAWGLPLATAEGVDSDLRGRAVAAAAAARWMTGDVEEALGLATLAADLTSDTWARTTAIEILGDVAGTSGDFPRAEAAYGELLSLARALEHPGLVAQAELGLALIDHFRGDDAEARGHARTALAEAQRAQSPSVRALAHYVSGEVLAEQDPDRALVELDIAREVALAGRARLAEGVTRTAEVALRGRHGDPDEALRRYGEALEVWRDPGADGLLLNTLRNLVVLLVRIGADTDAVTLDAVITRLGSKPTFAAEARDLDAARRAAHQRLSEADRARSEAAGSHITDLRAAATMATGVLERITRERSAPA